MEVGRIPQGPLVVVVFLIFVAVSLYIALSVLELIMQTNLASNPKLTEIHLSVPPGSWD